MHSRTQFYHLFIAILLKNLCAVSNYTFCTNLNYFSQSLDYQICKVFCKFAGLNSLFADYVYDKDLNFILFSCQNIYIVDFSNSNQKQLISLSSKYSLSQVTKLSHLTMSLNFRIFAIVNYISSKAQSNHEVILFTQGTISLQLHIFNPIQTPTFLIG